MNRISTTSGQEFRANSSETLLDAASRAGLSLPYSCKTGRCSTCKCKVISGSTIELHSEVGLTVEQKREGWILSCVRTAASDVVLDIDDLGGVVLPAVKTLPCRISHIELRSPDVILATLRLPPTAEFCFIPGQYIDVIGPDGIRRSYSIANGSFVDRLIELHIRAVPNGAMSEYWFKRAKTNDLLRLVGPMGSFFLRDTSNMDLVFLATGTGIAPVKAMLESLSDLPEGKMPLTVTVLWGGRVSKDIYFNVSSILGDFKFVSVLSRADPDWTGARGYVQNHLLTMQPDLGKTAVYACGSDKMVRSAKEMLTQQGLVTSQFYSDAFVCSS